MKEVLQFLNENPTFYLATVEGTIPKVRPFGFAMDYQGKLYFCTSNKKKVYQQLTQNPYFEISTTSKEHEWLRLKGRAVFHSTKETKQAALAAAPFLSNLYSVDDPSFELFYIEEAEAVFYNRQGVAKTIRF